MQSRKSNLSRTVGSRRASVKASLAAVALVASTLAGLTTSAAAADAPGNPAPLSTQQRSDLVEQHLSIGRTSGGQAALVNSALADRGVTSAAAPGAVTLSWKPYTADARYTIVRGETPLTTTKPGQATFKDTNATAGASYQYRIIPELKGDTSTARTWGLSVAVPEVNRGETEAAAVQRTATTQAAAAKAAATTTLTWTTFIPQKYINQPIPRACKYWGSKYVYGGDNRGFDWKSSRYRTSASAVINWRSHKVSGYTSVKTTHVYKKSNKKLVAKKTASAKDMKVKKLGAGSGYADIRMVTHSQPILRRCRQDQGSHRRRPDVPHNPRRLGNPLRQPPADAQPRDLHLQRWPRHLGLQEQVLFPAVPRRLRDVRPEESHRLLRKVQVSIRA